MLARDPDMARRADNTRDILELAQRITHSAAQARERHRLMLLMRPTLEREPEQVIEDGDQPSGRVGLCFDISALRLAELVARVA